MALNLLSKPALIGVGLGAAATPAIGYGGVVLYRDVINPTADRYLTRRGYGPNIPTPELEDKDPHNSGHHNYDCFRNFFPGSEYVTTISASTDDWPSDKNSIFDPEPTADSKPTDPLGCTVMQLKYNGKDGDNKNKFLFKSEVAVKSGRFGWVLWNRFERSDKNDASKTKFTFENTIILLEQQSADRWSVIGAFDQEEEIDNFEVNKLHISDGSNGWSISDGGDPSPSGKTFVGMWEVTGAAGDKEIFQDLKINYDSRPWFVLNGKYQSKDPQSGGVFDGYKLFNDSQPEDVYIYAKGEAKPWLCLDGSAGNRGPMETSIKRGLDLFYAPFRGRKGKWRVFDQKICEDPKNRKGMNTRELDKLKSFCYRKDH